jgi:hypothetical protein
VPKQDQTLSQKRASNRPLGPQGSIYISELLNNLNQGKSFLTSVKLCNTHLEIDLQMIQSELTMQPNRVIEVAFHRLIKLDPASDFIPTKFNSGQERPNNISMVLMEQPCINQLNEIARAADFEERGGLSTNNDIVKGSVNDRITSQSNEE